MLRTRVGYAGGTTARPTYRSIGDHSEAIEIDFDPEVISFKELTQVFFESHNACASPWSTQYRSAAFPRDAEQRRILEATKREAADLAGTQVLTAIEDFSGFTLAEDYHQKYKLRRIARAVNEFAELFPTTESFLGSVAVTKANALVGGALSAGAFGGDLRALGLSPEATAAVARASR